MSLETRLASAHDLVGAFNRHDIEGCMSLISESAVCDRGDGGAGLRRDECAAFLDALLNAFPDARLSEARAAIVGEKAILEWTFEGTHLGAWPSPTRPSRRAAAPCDPSVPS